MLQIYLLGTFAVKLDAVPTNSFETTSARALLAYLAFYTDQPQPRERLAALLWGADAGATGLTNLRSCLRRVRYALGDQEGTNSAFLDVGRESVQLKAQATLWVDVQAFETLLAQVKAHHHRHLADCPWCMARLTEAAALYRGPLLADLELKSGHFEEWQLGQRERLHRQAMQICLWLADYHQRQGAYAVAEEYARRQLALEPWNEEAHQQLMRSLYASGQRTAALAQYQRCRQLVREHLDVEPTAATNALYQQVRQGREPSEQPVVVPTYQHLPLTLPAPINLPTPTTSLLDRSAELEWLLYRLTAPEHRLVTVTGEGGVGKTRLALAAAQAVRNTFRDGVWFVPLADLPPSAAPAALQAQIIKALVEVLEIPLEQESEPRQQVFRYLRPKELLLVLDTFEHLLAGSALVGELLQRAPRLTLLVTTRQPLPLQAQHLLRLQGFACIAQKPPGWLQSGQGVIHHALIRQSLWEDSHREGAEALPAGVQLFVARARQWQPHFHLTATHLAAVSQICQFVRGLPLAIELAAGLLPHMSPDFLAKNLSHSLDLLTSEQVDLAPRHRNLRQVFAWSWQLLTPALQQIFVQLARLPGGFTAEDAQIITGATPALLTALVERSLLHVDEAGCYCLHDLLRAFAAEQPGTISIRHQER